MNKKGQALIEFIIILPIIIILLLGIVDFAFIISKSNALEGKINDVVEMYNHDESYEAIKKHINNKKITLEFKNKDNKFVNIILKEKYNLLTPGLNLLIDNPYVISTKRVVYYE